MSRIVNALRRAAAFWFFVLGLTAIVGVILLKRGLLSPPLVAALHVLDLPLLLSGMTFGGASLYRSMVPEGKSAPILAVLIAVVLLGGFGVFAYMNFALPFAEF